MCLSKSKSCGMTIVLFLFLFNLLFSISVFAERKVEGYVGQGGGPIEQIQCVSDEQRQKMRNEEIIPNFETQQLLLMMSNATTLFEDPMGNGGLYGFGNAIINYVDLDGSPGVLDYNCSGYTYDGHRGTDINIRDFYDMDEGVAVLAAATGVVTLVHDGEDDRHLAASGINNGVFITHADNSKAIYYHFKKNSIRVEVGQIVNVGDTIGFVGSSGFSTYPHLHFEVENSGSTVDPFNGSCQSGTTWWNSQPAYVMDEAAELFTHGVTKIPISIHTLAERWPSATHVEAGTTIRSWVSYARLKTGDSLSWTIHSPLGLWADSYSIMGSDYPWSWWYKTLNLPSSASFYGVWNIDLYLNGVLLGQQIFTLDNNANQAPSMLDQSFIVDDLGIDEEFVASDADGSIAWYELLSGPSHGTLKQDGGRWRKFNYTPDPGMTHDTITVRPIDDDSTAGTSVDYVFQLGAGFNADVTFGWVPFDVQFNGESGLSVDTWKWAFGDGDSAFVQSPIHSYLTNGLFTVGLEIDAAGEVREVTKPSYVLALADTLRADSILTGPGENVEITISLNNTVPVNQINIPIEYGGDMSLTYDSFSTVGCRTDYFDDQQYIQLDAWNKRFTLMLRTTPLGFSPDLPAGDGDVVKLYFKTSGSATDGNVNLIKTEGYGSNLPTLQTPFGSYTTRFKNGSITIGSIGCCIGIRGNIDGDLLEQIDISDLVALVDFMFTSGPAPVCLEEGNVNGDIGELIDISDLVILVDFMFNSGPPPASCP